MKAQLPTTNPTGKLKQPKDPHRKRTKEIAVRFSIAVLAGRTCISLSLSTLNRSNDYFESQKVLPGAHSHSPHKTCVLSLQQHSGMALVIVLAFGMCCGLSVLTVLGTHSHSSDQSSARCTVERTGFSPFARAECWKQERKLMVLWFVNDLCHQHAFLCRSRPCSRKILVSGRPPVSCKTIPGIYSCIT